jgi:hypothetical protein
MARQTRNCKQAAAANMNKRALVEIIEEDDCAVKRVHVEGAQVRVHATTKGEAQTLLRAVLVALKPLSTTAAFPYRCLEIARSEIAEILDSPFNARRTLLLRAETADGRTLGLVLLLAAACASDGLSAIQADRASFDDSRTRPTQSWLSWGKRVRRSSCLLTKHRVTSWSSIRPALFNKDGVQTLEHDDMESTTGSIVFDCWQEHGDADSIHTLSDADLACDCCGVAWTNCDQQFYRCQECGLEMCGCCESRRINFK